MPGRQLSDDEVKALGLENDPSGGLQVQGPAGDFASTSATSLPKLGRQLSDAEAAQLGLEDQPQPSGPGEWEALGRGVAQGGTLGLADEISGGFQAGLAKLAQTAPGIANRIGIETKYADELHPEEIYREARDEWRTGDEAALRAHPGLYIGGDLAGGLISGAGANSLAAKALGYSRKGLAGIQALRAATLGGAASGMVQGIGSSQGNVRQQGIDALKGAGLSVAIPGAMLLAKTGPAALRSGIEALRVARLPAAEKARMLLQDVAESGTHAPIETLPAEFRGSMISAKANELENSIPEMQASMAQQEADRLGELEGTSAARPSAMARPQGEPVLNAQAQHEDLHLKMPANEREAIAMLRSKGVPLSKGQQNPGGVWDKLEEVGQHSILGGEHIRNVRGGALGGWQNAVMNEVRPIPGQVGPGTMAEKLDRIYKDFGTAYRDVKGESIQALGATGENALAPLDKAFAQAAADPAIYATDAERASVAKWLSNQATPGQLGLKNIDPHESVPLVKAENVLKLRSNIRTQIRKLSAAGRHPEADLLERAEQSLTGGLEQQLSPRAAESLRSTDAAYSRFKVLEDAMRRAGDQPQSFTPAQLSAAVRAAEEKGSYARGGGEGIRALAAAGRQVLENKQPMTGAKALTGPFGMNHFAGPLAALANSPLPRGAVRVGPYPLRAAVKPQVLLPLASHGAARYGPLLLPEGGTQ